MSTKKSTSKSASVKNDRSCGPTTDENKLKAAKGVVACEAPVIPLNSPAVTTTATYANPHAGFASEDSGAATPVPDEVDKPAFAFPALEADICSTVSKIMGTLLELSLQRPTDPNAVAIAKEQFNNIDSDITRLRNEIGAEESKISGEEPAMREELQKKREHLMEVWQVVANDQSYRQLGAARLEVDDPDWVTKFIDAEKAEDAVVKIEDGEEKYFIKDEDDQYRKIMEGQTQKDEEEELRKGREEWPEILRKMIEAYDKKVERPPRDDDDGEQEELWGGEKAANAAKMAKEAVKAEKEAAKRMMEGR